MVNWTCCCVTQRYSNTSVTRVSIIGHISCFDVLSKSRHFFSQQEVYLSRPDPSAKTLRAVVTYANSRSISGGKKYKPFLFTKGYIYPIISTTDWTWKQNKVCVDTHCVLLLLTGSTVHGVCPSRTWWDLEVIAGFKGDWNSHPHTVSSVWPSGGAVRGKNCVNKAEYTVPP